MGYDYLQNAYKLYTRQTKMYGWVSGAAKEGATKEGQWCNQRRSVVQPVFDSMIHGGVVMLWVSH